MADEIRLVISAQDEATEKVRQLANTLRQLQLQQESYISGFRKFEGVAAYERQAAAIRENIKEVERLSAAQERAQRFMQAQSAFAAERAANVLFPPDAVENVHGYGKAIEELEKQTLNWGQGARHSVAIFDEAMRGQRGAIVASTSALIRDTHILQVALEHLTAPWIAFGAAATAAAAIATTAIHFAEQRMQALRDTQAALAIQGFGANPALQADIAANYDRNRQATNEWRGAETELQKELNKLPATAQESRQAFEDLAKALAGIKREDPAKAIEEFVKAAQKSPESVAKLASEFWNLRGITNAAGLTLEEQLKTLTTTDEKYKAVMATIQQVRGPVLDAGQAARTAGNNWLYNTMALIGLASAGGQATEAITEITRDIERVRQPFKEAAIAADTFTETIRAQNEIVAGGNKTLDDRTEALNRLTMAQGAAARLAATPGAGEYGIGQGAAERAANAVANLEAEQRRSKLQPAEEEAHRQRLEHINAEAAARRADLAAQTEAAQKRLEEAERVARLRYPGGDPRQDVEVQQARSAFEEAQRRQADETRRIEIEGARTVGAEYARGTQARIDAQQKVVDLIREGVAEGRNSATELAKEEKKLQDTKREASDEARKAEIDNLRAVVSETARGSQERIAAQEAVIAKVRQDVAEQKATVRELAQEERTLANLKRELANKTFQESRDFMRQEVELAKGNVDQIIAAYNRLRQAAKATGQAPAVFAQIDREQVRDLESAQSQAFTKVMEFNSSVERQDNMRIKAYEAQLQVQVAQHAISKDQMAAKEAAFTSQVMAQEEQRVEAELKTIGLTEAQRIRLYDHLAELYQKDAERQLQAQQKLTQAIEAENTKRLRSLQNMFDSVGTASERLIEQALTRSATRQQAFKEFGQSIVKSIVTEVGHLGSQFAGKSLASSLGVKTEGMTDTGIGSVLSRYLGDALGLTKTSTGTEAMKGVADKMQKAADAQQKAVDLQQKAGETLQKAGEALLQAADKRGVSSGFSRSGAASGLKLDEEPSSQASAAVNFALEHTGERLKNYCAKLVNESLERAGVSGSGSALASSFKTFGSPVSPGDVRKGDIFYSGPSGWGDTGHVGFTMGPVSGGKVQVVSSHMQGDPNNPAGSEYRDASNLIFRRPDYSQQLVSGMQELNSTQQQSIQATDQSTQTNETLYSVGQRAIQTDDQSRQAITQNTQAVTQNTQKQGSQVSLGSSASTSTSYLNLFTQGLGIAASGLAIFGSHLSTSARTILGTVGVLSQLISFGKNLGSIFDTTSTATKAVSTATSTLQLANTGNTLATTANTAATYANSAAQSSSSAFGGIGSIFKAIPIIGALFEHGGIVPSAAGGMVVPGAGTFAILHPREMVLPAHLSQGLQNLLSGGRFGAPEPANSMTFNYHPNVTGFHPYKSRSDFEAMLRTHGSTLMRWAESAMRNGYGPNRAL